jgi:geranylgeranyl diphosphate synthase, type II
MNLLEKFSLRIAEEIRRLDIKGSPAELYEPVEYVLSIGGKRIRPALVLLGCDLFNGETERALPPALGIEVFHNFTLLHDDIMDNAPIRRSKPTVHEKWSINTAILSGDAMFVKAYQLVSQVEDSVLRPVLDLFSRTALDMNFEGRENVSIAEYERMIELKTAVLLGTSLKIGALVAKASGKEAGLLYDFGRNLGIAFQLQDDLLDVYGDKAFGKQTGGDIIAGKKTYLLLKALELAEGENQRQLNRLLSRTEGISDSEKVTGVTAIFDELDIAGHAREEMRLYFDKAMDSLERISVSPEKKKGLGDFAEQLMERKI